MPCPFKEECDSAMEWIQSFVGRKSYLFFVGIVDPKTKDADVCPFLFARNSNTFSQVLWDVEKTERASPFADFQLLSAPGKAGAADVKSAVQKQWHSTSEGKKLLADIEAACKTAIPLDKTLVFDKTTGNAEFVFKVFTLAFPAGFPRERAVVRIPSADREVSYYFGFSFQPSGAAGSMMPSPQLPLPAPFGLGGASHLLFGHQPLFPAMSAVTSSAPSASSGASGVGAGAGAASAAAL
jgi:hypothetical protein